MMYRREFTMAGLSAGLVGCAGSVWDRPVTFEQMRLYADDLADALSAAANAYITSPGAKHIDTVLSIQGKLQQVRHAIDGLRGIDTSDTRSLVLQLIAFVQQIFPLVAPFLGPVEPYIPIALNVLHAFLSALPLPPEAPPYPPAPLHALAMLYRGEEFPNEEHGTDSGEPGATPQ